MKPPLVFLEGTTSAFDEAAEARLYSLIRTAPWRPTVVSVGRKSMLHNFHDYLLDLAGFR